MFDFTGKVVLVTGGGRGLGLEMARAFAERGADLIVASRKLEACEAAAESFRKLGRRALAVAAHLGRWSDAERLADAAYEAFGRVDVLVNNAGMGPRAPSEAVTEALFDSVLALNLKGPFRLSSLIGSRMREGEGGVILNISSSGAIRPLPAVTPYAAAKAGLNQMSVCLAHEFGPKVRVNTISAGPFLTDISKAWPPEARERADNALGRPGHPSEIVSAALFLASPASSFVTGALVQVDGGM